MRKKITAITLALTSGFTFATLLTTGIKEVAPSLSQDSSTWVHYSRKDPKLYENGIREYWVRCGGEYRFTKPASGIIEEATQYDTSGFTENDPRYIKYIKDDKAVFFTTEETSYRYEEISELTGYTCAAIPANEGEQLRVDWYKDDHSPMYSANVMKVRNAISSISQLGALQSKIDAGIVDGYYVLTNDLIRPNTYVNSKPTDTAGVFSGTFDGRGNGIGYPSFWGYRMLGTTKNATIKNLSFSNIQIFSVIAAAMYNTDIINCTFRMDATINGWSNYGMISDYFYGSTRLMNVEVDYGTHDHITLAQSHFTAPLAAYNYVNDNAYSFQNVTVSCLPSINMFKGDSKGRSLRPEEITYINTYELVTGSTTTYKIRYPQDDSNAKLAAEFIKKALEKVSNATFTTYAFDPTTTSFTCDTPVIVLGDPEAVSKYYIDLPSKQGSYSIKNVGKAIYINATDEYGWHPAVLKFLENTIGYENIGDGISIHKVKDPTHIPLYNINICETTPFLYRKADAGDSVVSDVYADGYNVASYTSNENFISVPGIAEDPKLSSNEIYHTTMRLLYPGTYYSSHPKWYAVNSYGSTYALSSGSYITWQLCYTCRGNTSEYNQMVETTTEKIIDIFKNATNPIKDTINLAIDDNGNCCKCSYCRSAKTKYGSDAGALVKFVNDVSTAVNNRINETNRTKIIFSTFAYQAYRDAPVNSSGDATITFNEHSKVFLAPIQANFTHPINDDTYNSEAHSLFENWSKVGPIYSWLYDTNFSHYLYPYNSFTAIPESIKYMANIGVELAYVEGQHNVTCLRTGFNALKKFINGRYMIDLDQDYNQLTTKFFNNYYGVTASSKMLKFYNELVARLDTFDTNSTYKSLLYSGNKLSIYSNIDSAGLWDKDQVLSWVNLCDEAISSTSDAKLINHIKAEEIFPLFLLCDKFSTSFDSATLLSLRQKFKTIATSLNVTLLMENNQTTIQSIYTSWGI